MVPLPFILNSTLALGLALVCQSLVADDTIPPEQISPIELTLKLASNITDPSHRAHAFIEIAEAQLVADQQRDALDTLNRAVSDLAASLRAPTAAKDLVVKAASMIAKAGDIERALEIIRTLRPGSVRIAFAKIASEIAVDGDMAAAIQLAEADPMHRRVVLMRIIIRLSHNGEISKALSLVKELKDSSSWDQRRASIVSAAVTVAIRTDDLEVLEEAMQILPEFESTYRMLTAKIEIGTGAAHLGNAALCQRLFSEALDGIDAIKNPIWKITLQMTMADGLLTLGSPADANSAIERAMKATDALSYRPSQETVIVRTLQQASDLFAEHGYKTESLDFLQRALCQAQQIAIPEDRVTAYLAMAPACVALGDEERLTDLLSEALQSARESNQGYLEDNVRRDFAIALARMGNDDKAIQLLTTLTSPSMRSGCLSRVAYFRVQEGRDNAAIDAVIRFETPELRNQTLANLASRLGKEKRLDSALKAIEQITDLDDRDVGRRLCAVALARSGAAAEGVRVALLIDNGTVQRFAMDEIARIVSESGDIETATKLLTEHLKLIDKSGLAPCVKLLATAGHVEQAIISAQRCEDARSRSVGLFNIAFILATERVPIAMQVTASYGPRRMKDAFTPPQTTWAGELLNTPKPIK